MSASPRETARRAGLVLGIVSICLGAVLGVTAVAASAKQPTFPKAFSPVATENTYDGDRAFVPWGGNLRHVEAALRYLLGRSTGLAIEEAVRPIAGVELSAC